MFFFFNDTATTEIYTLSLHDALPISEAWQLVLSFRSASGRPGRSFWTLYPLEATSKSSLFIQAERIPDAVDRKSTRLNSSHGYISYAVFCLKKKKETADNDT